MKTYYYRVIVDGMATDFADFDSARDFYYTARHSGVYAQFICL